MNPTSTATCVGGRFVPIGQSMPPAPLATPAIEPEPDVDLFAGLTKRERQVLDVYMDLGMAKRVASELHISIKTVEVHLVRIREKTGYSRCIHLARAYERRLLEAQQGGFE